MTQVWWTLSGADTTLLQLGDQVVSIHDTGLWYRASLCYLYHAFY